MDNEALKILHSLRDEMALIHQYIRQGDMNLAIWELGRIYTSICYVCEHSEPKEE